MILFSLLLIGSACRHRGAEEETKDVHPNATPESLALSYLKAADVELAHQTVEAAKTAVHLATKGLEWAPPRSRIRPWLVGRLLLSRARALTQLAELESARADLDAALTWTNRDKQHHALQVAEIHLLYAEILLRNQKTTKAHEHIEIALSDAARLGADGAGLFCDALILQGDLAIRLGESAPQSYYAKVFSVAAQYDYPEDTWPHMDRALARLDIQDEAQRQALMGPVEERRAELEEEEAITKTGGRRSSNAESAFASVASGSVPNADSTVAAMRQGFSQCYQRALTTDPEASGSARLTLSVDGDGQIVDIQETHDGLSASLVDCIVSVARGERFPRPTTTDAVVVVPVTFVRQR